MKKLYILSTLAMLTAMLGYSQSQRLVLLEHFSGASCPPCATVNPGVNNLLTQNSDKIVSIKYQLAPPGTDPMFEHNEAHSINRLQYYGVTGIPHSVMDGNYFNGYPTNWNATTINNRYNISSPFDVAITYQVTPTHLNATVVVTASQDFTGNTLRLHTVVVEKNITFPSPAGSNGETSFSHVMKYMLPNQNGTTLDNSWTNGQSETFELSWPLANVYNINQLAVVAFVQNNTTKEVHQTGYSFDPEYTSDFMVAANTENLAGLPLQVCDESLDLSPSFLVTNFGTETITDMDIVVDINGVEYPYAWSGNLELFENTTVTVPSITLNDLLPSNEVVIFIDAINGSPNEFESQMTSSFAVKNIGIDANVAITFDCWPQEVSWQLRKVSNNSLAASGSNYPASQSGQTVNIPVTLEADECYRFTLNDQYGDGMNGSQWNECSIDGSVEISDDNGLIAWEYDGSYEYNTVIAEFSASGIVSSEDVSKLTGLSLFPNPTSGMLNIEFDLLQAQNTQIDIFDIAGKRVMAKALGNLGEGYHMNSIDMSELQPGLYIVNFITNKGTEARKVLLSK